MFVTLAAALAILAGAPSDSAVVVPVRAGTRLEVAAFRGAITVLTWKRNDVRVEAGSLPARAIELEQLPRLLRIRADRRRPPLEPMDLNIMMPRWMDVRLQGVMSDISVVGSDAEVRAETVRGDVIVKGGRGTVALQSVQGGISLEGARGRVEAHTLNEPIRLSDVEGAIRAESINGRIELDRIRSADVECSTVGGAVDYRGELRDGGSYHFSSHNGDLDVAVPAGAGAAVSVSTYSGGFESSFPVQLERGMRARRFAFTIGSGGADLELESFQGTIRLRRAGEREPGRRSDERGTP